MPIVESCLNMELFLNLAWGALAVVIVRLWMLHAPRERASRRTQIAALAMLILILFPVISVTDDLQAAQNPAEDDISMRRDHATANPHSIFPVAAGLPTPNSAELSFGFIGYFVPSGTFVPSVDNPALFPVQNRPPPVA